MEKLRQKLFDDDWRGWVAAAPLAALLAIVTGIILTTDGVIRDLETSAVLILGTTLASWALYGLLYVGLTVWVYGELDAPNLHARLSEFKPRKRRGLGRIFRTGGHTTWSVTSAFVAIVLVVAVLASPYSSGRVWVYVLAVTAVAACWLMLAASMALAYGRLNAEGDDASFVRVTGVEGLVFKDYLAVSMLITATLSAPGTTFSGRGALTIVRTHGVVAFLFNSVVVALLVALLLSQFA